MADAGRRDRVRRAVDRAVADRSGTPPDWADPTHEGALAALQDAAGRPYVVVVGGDGTVQEAATALAGTDTHLAIIPGGTGNVLAGSLRIRGIDAALRLLRDGAPRRLDLGQARWGGVDGSIHERVFTVACGMGFDARIMAAAEKEWKRRLLFGAYIGAAVRELTRLEPAHFTIRADDRTIELDGLVVLVGNCGDLIPGRLGAREPLDPTDGRLDLIVVGGRNVVEGLVGAVDLLVRKGEQEGRVVRRPVRHVRIEAEPAQPLQTDGDHHPPGWLEATILPAALSVLAPAT